MTLPRRLRPRRGRHRLHRGRRRADDHLGARVTVPRDLYVSELGAEGMPTAEWFRIALLLIVVGGTLIAWAGRGGCTASRPCCALGPQPYRCGSDAPSSCSRRRLTCTAWPRSHTARASTCRTSCTRWLRSSRSGSRAGRCCRASFAREHKVLARLSLIASISVAVIAGSGGLLALFRFQAGSRQPPRVDRHHDRDCVGRDVRRRSRCVPCGRWSPLRSTSGWRNPNRSSSLRVDTVSPMRVPFTIATFTAICVIGGPASLRGRGTARSQRSRACRAGSSLVLASAGLPDPSNELAPGCFQSPDNFPHQVAAALGLRIERSAAAAVP